MFEKLELTDKVLPLGDYLIEASTEDLMFSSTSKWYRLKVNSSVVFTTGIVHVESNTLTLPISMAGVELEYSDSVRILSRTTYFTESLGEEFYSMRFSNQTATEKIRDSDIFTFIASNSFARSFFKGLQKVLPVWLTLMSPEKVFLPVSELKTELLIGSAVRMNRDCKEAPVFNDKLYNVFVFSIELVLELFGDFDSIMPTEDQRICVVTDISTEGGTVFLLFPPRPPLQLPAFANSRQFIRQSADALKSALTVNEFRGFGISFNKDIIVEKTDETVKVWNGDHLIDYRFAHFFCNSREYIFVKYLC